MAIDYGKPAKVRSMRIPDSLWKKITTFHKTNTTHSWEFLSNTIRVLIEAGLEHLEKKPEPETTKKKRGRPRKEDVRPNPHS